MYRNNQSLSKILSSLLSGFLLLGLSACGDDTDDSSLDDVSSVDDVVDTGTLADTGAITRSTEFFGNNGNLWKPVADETSVGAGNLVVLFSSSFRSQFDRCEVQRNDGTTAQLRCIDDQPFTQIPFSCFSNGNRQTWRADFRCGSAAAVSVTCFDANQEVTFTVPEGQRGNVCSRFG